MYERVKDKQRAIAVEAKGDEHKLRKLIEGMNSRVGSATSGHKRDHPKCVALAYLRPPYFWAVAGGYIRELS